MKKLAVLSFLVISAAVCAQTDTADYYSKSMNRLSPKDRVSASVSAGAGVSVFNNSETAFSTYIAPKISYQISHKFRLNLGFMHYTATGGTFMPISSNEALYNPTNRSLSGNMIMAGGDYLLNSRTILSGAVMVDANNFGSKENNFKAATFGVEYKVSRNSSIRFETTVSQGQGGYYNAGTPFGAGSSSFGNNFMNSNSIFR